MSEEESRGLDPNNKKDTAGVTQAPQVDSGRVRDKIAGMFGFKDKEYVAETVGRPNPNRLKKPFGNFEPDKGSALSAEYLISSFDGTLLDGRLAMQASLDDEGNVVGFRAVQTKSGEDEKAIRASTLSEEPRVVRSPESGKWLVPGPPLPERMTYENADQRRLDAIAGEVSGKYSRWSEIKQADPLVSDFRIWLGSQRVGDYGRDSS